MTHVDLMTHVDARPVGIATAAGILLHVNGAGIVLLASWLATAAVALRSKPESTKEPVHSTNRLGSTRR